MEENNKVQDHLDAAKEEIKSAAATVVSDTKDKAKEIVADIATTVSDAADKLHDHVAKVETEVKK